MADTFKLLHGTFTPGSHVWVVQRDESGRPVDVTGFMFLASACNAVFACSFINDMTEVEETLDYLIEETEEEDLFGEIGVFRGNDCYLTRDRARAALSDEMEEWKHG